MMVKIPFRPLNGVLLLDKSRDVSSNKALQDARFTYRAKKAGHTGTLDPFATGLLPVCFGEANKYARWLFDAEKTYRFEAMLGHHSTTGDTEGVITVVDTHLTLTDAQLRETATAFTGDIKQTPPAYSAIKIDGKRAYELARKGERVKMPIRQVTIHALELSAVNGKLLGVARVSKGTYIRTLVEDIATHLGTVAYCRELRRVQIGHLIDHHRPMHTVNTLRAIDDEVERDQLLLPMDLLCQQFPAQAITHQHWERLIQGRKDRIHNAEQGIVRLYLDDEFCGLGEIQGEQLKAFRLLNTGF